jgi:hypothetical protein
MEGDTLLLSWNVAQDEQTPPIGLCYNVRIGMIPGGNDVLSPMSDDDFLKKTYPGNAGNRKNLKLLNPVAGTYYWSVQTIDQGFAASPFTNYEQLVVTAIAEKEKTSGLTIYPNPAHDRVWIQYAEAGLYQIRILELTGRELLSKRINLSQQSVPLSLHAIKSGIYLIEIRDNTSSWQQKLILY